MHREVDSFSPRLHTDVLPRASGCQKILLIPYLQHSSQTPVPSRCFSEASASSSLCKGPDGMQDTLRHALVHVIVQLHAGRKGSTAMLSKLSRLAARVGQRVRPQKSHPGTPLEGSGRRRCQRIPRLWARRGRRSCGSRRSGPPRWLPGSRAPGRCRRPPAGTCLAQKSGQSLYLLSSCCFLRRRE